ncbi:F-actin-capping protein subunit alpha [Orbilia oligospora]|uniref:F-actin-capping protein subunit alpha n=1 Tax=Orbilia oligospora TaxID=2813651 RepID=A0A7C8PAP8_ORBOL|nr:F-actin-capping protein subunit alpha [Orbilia oligospora]
MSADQTAASFIENAPPGELAEVINDIGSLLDLDKLSIQEKVAPAVEKYNKEQFVTTKLPGGSDLVIVSSYNDLGGGRFFDSESSSSFAYNHSTQKASEVQSHPIEGEHAGTIKSLLRDVGNHVKEHFPSLPAYGVYPTDEAVDVHYYEDGNVRLVTQKRVNENLRSSTASGIATAIGNVEKKYQEELNRAFGALSEGAFKSLRRQLPVTRQKMDWQKASAYKIGQDIGGGSRR